MKTGLIGCILGMLIGAGIALGFVYDRSRAFSTALAEGGSGDGGAAQADLLQLRENLMVSQARVHQLEQQNFNLAWRVQRLMARQSRELGTAAIVRPEVLVGIPAEDAEGGKPLVVPVDEDPEELARRMAAAIKMRVEQEIETRIARMKRTRAVSPEQEATVRARLQELLEEAYGLTGADPEPADPSDWEGMAGEPEPEGEFAEAGEELFDDPGEPLEPEELDPTEELLEVTDVQTLAIRRAEFEIAQFRTWTSLTPAQEHQLAIVLVEYYRALLNPRFGLLQSEASPQALNQKMMAIRNSGILSPAQYQEIYQRITRQVEAVPAQSDSSTRVPTGFGSPANQ